MDAGGNDLGYLYDVRVYLAVPEHTPPTEYDANSKPGTLMHHQKQSRREWSAVFHVMANYTYEHGLLGNSTQREWGMTNSMPDLLLGIRNSAAARYRHDLPGTREVYDHAKHGDADQPRDPRHQEYYDQLAISARDYTLVDFSIGGDRKNTILRRRKVWQPGCGLPRLAKLSEDPSKNPCHNLLPLRTRERLG